MFELSKTSVEDVNMNVRVKWRKYKCKHKLDVIADVVWEINSYKQDAVAEKKVCEGV